MPKIRIFYTSDVHGSEKCFRKFVSAAKFYKANVIILAGDLTGKVVVPIVRQLDGTHYAEYFDFKQTARSQDELDKLEDHIRASGYYPYITEPNEFEELKADESKINKLFSKLMVETIKRWIEIADNNLKDTNVKCLISPGNDDSMEIDTVLKDSVAVINPEERVIDIENYYEMITCGWTTPTPWKTARECSEEELSKKIENMIAQVKDIKSCIFNLHNPPYDSRLDLAPLLDANLKPAMEGGGIKWISAGSKAVRAAIEKYQPLLSLHGHMHESRGIYKLGSTLCINPGSEYTMGILRGVLVNVEDKKVKSYVLTSG